MNMKLLILGLSIIVLSSCADKRIIYKSITKGNATVIWYQYSYITSGSPHVIELKNNNFTSVIGRDIDTYIKDISISNDTIYIDRRGFHKKRGVEVILEGYALGYHIKNRYKEK